MAEALERGDLKVYGPAEDIKRVRVADQVGEFDHQVDNLVVVFHPGKELLMVTGRVNGEPYMQVHQRVQAFSFGPEPEFFSDSYSAGYN